MHYWHKHKVPVVFFFPVQCDVTRLLCLRMDGEKNVRCSHLAVWEWQHRPLVNQGFLNPGTHWKISLQVSFSIVMLAVLRVNSHPLFCYSVDFVWRMEEIQRLDGAFNANVFRNPNGMTECSIRFEKFPSGILCLTACSLEEPLSLCIVVYVCTSSLPWRRLLLLFSPPVFGEVAHLQNILDNLLTFSFVML